MRDFTYALRMLRRNPLFSTAAAATLALGIAASTAIFSVTDAVLLKALPYPHEDRLVLVFCENRGSGRSFLFSNADFIDLRNATSSVFESLEGVAGFRAFAPTPDGGTEQVAKALVTTNFLRMLGAHVIYGRDFTEDDAAPEKPGPSALIPPGRAAILSYDYWQRRFGGSRSAIGQELAGAEGQRGPRVVGVLAPGFKLYLPPGASGTGEPDIWVANTIGYDTAHRNLLSAGAVARLRPGISLDQAERMLDPIAASLRQTVFDKTMVLRLEPVGRYLVREVRPAILALMGAVTFLLLIACANVAGLLLVRAALREREMAVRAAVGGGRWRLARQTLCEAGLLSTLATALGVCLAWFGMRALVSAAPNLPRLDEVALNWRVALFSAASGLVAVAVFGIVPALRAARPDLVSLLRTAGRWNTLMIGGRRFRNAVVVLQVALSFVLLVGSGLMFRSFVILRGVRPGYDPQGVLTFWVTRDWPLGKQEGRIELLRQIQSSLQAIPGVETASGALVVPLGGGPLRPIPGPDAAVQQVMPGYFETLRTPLLAGRAFTERDNAPGHNVAVIDDLLAARHFPGRPAVGERIALPDPNTPWAQVIGVVEHQRLGSLSDPGPGTLYLTDGFWGIGVSRYWMVRTTGDPSRYVAAVRQALAAVDRRLVISKVQTLEALVERDRSGTRFALLLLGMFALVAVLLAGVGLYGVIAGAARQRTAEIGIRMALGAEPDGIFRLVVGQGLKLTAIGVAAGFAAAVLVTRGLATMLVGVTPLDPLTFAIMMAVFFAIGAAAAWLPAARASRMDVTEALRDE